MNVTLAVLADYANVTQDGKVNIMGIFDTINCTKFPAVHPAMILVVQLEAGIAEVGKTHELEVFLMDEDGRRVFPPLKGKLTVGEVKPGSLFKTNNILDIRGLKFEKAGNYEFHILVNGEDRKSIPLRVITVTG